MEQRDMDALEAAAKMIISVIERARIHQEDAEERVRAFRLQVTENAIAFPSAPTSAPPSEEDNTSKKVMVVKFTEQEISKMSNTFKRQFIANGLAARVIKRKSGKSGICYEIRYRSNGYHVTASSTDLAEAKRKFIAKTTPAEIEKYRVEVGVSGMTKFSKLFEEWISYKESTRSINPKGLESYKTDFNSLPERLKKMPVKNIRVGMLTDVMRDVKPRKYEDLRTLFNGIFKYAVASGIISHNPVALIPFIRAERKNRGAIKKEDLYKFLRRIELPEFERIRQSGYLMYFFGLRPCEIDKDTRREGDFLITRNRKRKGGKIEYKKIPIPKQAEGLIDWGDKLTFGASDKTRYKLFTKLFTFGQYTAYNLRHTFSTLCQEAHVAQEVVEVWLGDSPQRLIGKVYTHFSDEFMRGEMDRVYFPTLDDL